MGLSGFVDWRQDYFSLGVSADYLRNQLFSEPTEFDRSYVQTLPRLTLSSIPINLVQSDLPLLQYIGVGFDGSLTRFHQVNEEENLNIRNANRISLQPYIIWHFFNKGPVSVNSRYVFDQQSYQFQDSDESRFGKNAGLLRSEVSFTMDKVFGLAFEEKIPIKYIPSKELKELRERKEQGLKPLQATEKYNYLVGEIEPFESDLAKDYIVQVRNSYKHIQEYKLLHHYISSESEYGNKRFSNQIRSNTGWFDYEDAVRSEEFLFGSNTTRTLIPPQNTLELQWNNSLIRKSPKVFNYLTDDKFLRDNFTYSKLGWFNVSQGYLLNEQDVDDERLLLTRLMISTGYTTDKWTLSLQEYYFHFEKENIFNLNFNRNFESLRLLSAYTYNSFGQTNLNTLSAGGQIRPTDTLGFAVLKDMDLEAKKNIRTTYSLDIMPNNNCWILNLNYRESLVDSRYFFNILFNFGDDNFSSYKENYFAIKRR